MRWGRRGEGGEGGEGEIGRGGEGERQPHGIILQADILVRAAGPLKNVWLARLHGKQTAVANSIVSFARQCMECHSSD